MSPPAPRGAMPMFQGTQPMLEQAKEREEERKRELSFTPNPSSNNLSSRRKAGMQQKFSLIYLIW